MLARRPPVPATSGSFTARVLGHLGDLDPVKSFTKAGAATDEGRFSYRLLSSFGKWYQATQSKTFMVHLANRTMLVSKDPRLYKQALGQFRNHFETSKTIRTAVGFFAPKNIFVQENEDWSRMRKVLVKSIGEQSLEKIPKYVATSVDKMTMQLEPMDGSPMTVVPEKYFPKLTFDIFHQIMYEWDPNTICNDEATSTLLKNSLIMSEIMGERILLPMPLLWKLPLKRNLMAQRARDQLMDLTVKLVDERRAECLAGKVTEDGKMFLDFFIAAADEKKVSQQELYDNIMGLFIAAFDTTSNTLTMLLNQLAVNPRVQNKLREELLKHFPNGASDIAKATTKQLEAVTYLQWTIDEVFRLTPTASVVNRLCVKDCVIDGYQFRAGDEFLIDGGGAAQDPENFNGQSDLNVFRPERFSEKSYDNSSFLPFGAGPRICPGRKIAIGETRAFCAYIVAKYIISRPVDGPPLRYDTKMTISTRDGHGTMLWTKVESQRKDDTEPKAPEDEGTKEENQVTMNLTVTVEENNEASEAERAMQTRTLGSINSNGWY